MSAFELHISTDNAAFDAEAGGDLREELARILRQAADDVALGYDLGRIKDVNGNRVGFWTTTPGPSFKPGDAVMVENADHGVLVGRIVLD